MTYASLDPRLFSHERAMAMPQIHEIIYNERLAGKLNLSALSASSQRTAFLSGQLEFDKVQAIAQAYAGHQFGHFNILGDGRAILLGEFMDNDGQRFDLQLKGSGPTNYSRRGDGLATTSAMLREYLISECMAGLGIETTRSLAVIETGLPVYREFEHRGAVLARIAKSHIRVGTFEYVAHFQDKKLMEDFTMYVIKRHYPELIDHHEPFKALLDQVISVQVDLIVEWLRVGFIHGVMNTDNMSIAGETIDYGPCAFMDEMDWGKVFSSIDVNGRYAFGRQAPIAQWNLACFASCLLPLLDSENGKSIEIAQESINAFVPLFEKQYQQMMREKLGLVKLVPGDIDLVEDLTQWMQVNQADYTHSFLALASRKATQNELFYSEEFNRIADELQEMKIQNHINTEQSQALMTNSNPVFIPRNHLVEKALEDATLRHDFTLYQQMLEASQQPYSTIKHLEHLYDASAGLKGYQTYCNT